MLAGFLWVLIIRRDIMKRMSKVFVILGMAAFIFSGCQKENTKAEPQVQVENDTYIENENDPKKKE